MSIQNDDFDSPWKQLLEWYFEEFMAFFFPEAHAQINWGRPIEFLDKELQQVVRDAALGRRYADLLVKVWLNDGTEQWVLAHVEVQGQSEAKFERRMYTYNYRLFDRYNRNVASFAILSDGNPRWRPGKFGYNLLGSTISFEFPITKLLDYQKQWAALVGNDNPFATVVMAHLKTLETQRDPTERYNWKFYLIRRFYERGYSREDVLNLLHFIDWLMQLPQDLEDQLRQEMYQLEATNAMQYITSFERLAKEEGRQEGRQEGLRQAHQSALRIILHILEHRFDEVPQPIQAQLASLSIEQLEGLVDSALAANVLDEFASQLVRFEA